MGATCWRCPGNQAPSGTETLQQTGGRHRQREGGQGVTACRCGVSLWGEDTFWNQTGVTVAHRECTKGLQWFKLSILMYAFYHNKINKPCALVDGLEQNRPMA